MVWLDRLSSCRIMSIPHAHSMRMGRETSVCWCFSTHTHTHIHTHTHRFLKMKKLTYFREELSPQLTLVLMLMFPLGKGTYLSLSPMAATPPSNPRSLEPT